MAPLTWRNVDSPSFASANQLYALAAELMNRGFNSASRGLDKFRKITTDDQSARLMQDVMAAGNDPAAIQQAAARGNAAFLSPEALRFANAQPGVLLDRQQAEANIAQTGVRTNVLQYGLDRSRITDGRQDTAYNAQQKANPLIYQAQQLARQGDLSGAQAIVSANADLFSRAGINASNLYGDLSGGFTGQMQDTERGVQHDDFMRIAGNATNARELIDLAGRSFATEADARRGIQDLQAQGLISADLAQTALGSLTASGLWTAPTAADEIMQRYGAAPLGGRGTTNPTWATGNNPVLNGFMSTIQRGGVTNPYALAAIQATGQHESGFDPGNAGRTWNDPSESGRPGTAGGIMSWNNERLAALQRFTGGDMSPEAQAAFFLQEDPQLIARLNNAGSVEEAQALMNNAWRFAGYNRPGGEAEARLNTARSIYSGTPLSFGSNVSRAGTQPGASVYDQLMAAAIQDPNRTSLTFGDQTWTPEGELQGRVADDFPVGSLMAAAIQDPNRTPLTFGSSVPRMGSQPGASMADQMLAAAANDPNRVPLTFGQDNWTPETQAATALTGQTDSVVRIAESGGPSLEAMVASPELARQNPKIFSQLLARDLRDNPVQTFGAEYFNNALKRRISAAMAEATAALPETIISEGTAGDNPLFTEVYGGVVARPPKNQQETQLIARAARAGILQTTPERAARQAEIDRASEMMREASDIAPNANRPYLQPGGLLGDAGMVAAQTGEAVVNQGAGLLDAVNAPFRMLSEYALGRDYIGGTGRVDWNGDGYSQSLTSPLVGTTRDNLTPEQRAALSGADQASNAMTAALSSNENGGQQPGQTPGRGQQPAATPTRPAQVSSTDLASFIRTAQSTGQVDRALNPFAPMDELLAGDSALSGDAASVAQQLTADGGKLSYMDTRTVRENIRELMRIPGVNSAAIAGALLAQNGVVYTGTEWNPLNWGSDDQIDADRAAEIWQQYQRPDAEGRTGIDAGVARLNNRGRTETAVAGIAQVQADYEALVTAMNQQIAQAPNQAQKDAIRQHFERNVFPLLYAQVQAIGASGALDRNANASTGQ